MIHRQAIYDKELNVYAYKLLSLDNIDNKEALMSINNSSHATNKAMLDTLSEIGFPQLAGNYPIVLNFNYGFLTGEEKIPELPNQLIIEIINDIEITENVISSVKTLSDKGHIIALNNRNNNH